MLGMTVIAVAIDGVVSAWGTHRPVANFAEQFVAGTLWAVTIAGPFAAGVYVGILVSARTKSALAQWTAGILVWFATGAIVYFASAAIPGVGWRYERMFDHDEFAERYP